jgi:hypothetical protein
MPHLLTTIGPRRKPLPSRLRWQRKAVTSTLSGLTRHHRYCHGGARRSRSPVVLGSMRTTQALTSPRAHLARANRIPFAIGFAVLASYSRLSYAANGSPASSSSASTYPEVYRKQQRGLKEIKSNDTQKHCLLSYYRNRRSCPRRTAIRDRSASRFHYPHAWSDDQFNRGTNGNSRRAEHQ